MPREGRLRIAEGDGIYHVYCRTAGAKGDFPFTQSGASRRFREILEFYARAYFCEVLSYCVMGNHYHIVVRFEGREVRSREELQRRALLLYPNSAALIDAWDEARWDRIDERLHDVSELMRNLHTTYATWHNRSFARQGRFWAERFRSTILVGARAVEECMQYVELNPVRAGLVARPEDWEASSFHERDMGLGTWLGKLRDVLGERSEKAALVAYRTLIYLRGEIPNKEGQAAISEEVVEAERARGFEPHGIFRKRIRHFTRGLVLGGDEQIREWLEKLRETGYYRRRKHPAAMGMEDRDGTLGFSLR